MSCGVWIHCAFGNVRRIAIKMALCEILLLFDLKALSNLEGALYDIKHPSHYHSTFNFPATSRSHQLWMEETATEINFSAANAEI